MIRTNLLARSCLVGRLLLSPLLVAVLLGVVLPGRVAARKAADFQPGRTFPRDGAAGDARKVIYLITWTHKKRPNEFGFADFSKDGDGVDWATVERIKRIMQIRYLNHEFFLSETNEADVKKRLEQAKQRKTRSASNWREVEQPAKVEPPKKVGDKRYAYADGNPKSNFEDLPSNSPPEFVMVDEVLKDGKVKLALFRSVSINRPEQVEVIRDGKKIIVTKSVPFQTFNTVRTIHILPDETAAVDGTGKKLSKAEVLARLKPGQIVLFSRDIRPSSPAFLGVLKPDTLILLSCPR